MTTTDPHAAARAMYQDYLVRRVHDHQREHANKIVKMIAGSSKTPVEPLATMGKDGGPLVCDVCGDPMILEGGGYQGVHADKAWATNPQEGWLSYISGGMTVLVETNGTLRVYHGYAGRSGCATDVDKNDQAARDAWRAAKDADGLTASDKLDLLSAYFRAELPECDSDDFLNQVYRVLFMYDPGPGVNTPTPIPPTE